MIITKQTHYSELDIRRMFETRSILNYMNDLILNIIDRYLEMIYKFKIDHDPMLVSCDPYVNHQNRNKIPGIKENIIHMEFNLSHADL